MAATRMALPMALAALAALLPGAALAVQLRGVSLEASTTLGPGADSATIEGPDCGHVKQIISKWSKAAKVGKLAGMARGAIESAEAAAEIADSAASQAREIGGAFADDAGDIPIGIEQAAGNADAASADATAAASALDTELGTFKSSISSKDMSGAGVEDQEIVSIKDLTKAAVNATNFAREVAKATVKKAEEEKAELLKDAGTMGKVAEKVLSAATSLSEEASELGQKAGYVADDADVLITKADDALTGLNKMLPDAGDQEPVLQAFIDDLDAKKVGVELGKGNVTEAVTTLETANTGLKANVTTVKDINTAVRHGLPAPETASSDLTLAEEATDTVDQALADMKAKVKTLMARMSKLKAKLKDAEKKLPPPEAKM